MPKDLFKILEQSEVDKDRLKERFFYLRRESSGISGVKIGGTPDALLMFNANTGAVQDDNTTKAEKQIRIPIQPLAWAIDPNAVEVPEIPEPVEEEPENIEPEIIIQEESAGLNPRASICFLYTMLFYSTFTSFIL